MAIINLYIDFNNLKFNAFEFMKKIQQMEGVKGLYWAPNPIESKLKDIEFKLEGKNIQCREIKTN